MERTKQHTRRHTQMNRISWKKIMEVAFWGTLIWGIIRMAFAYFHFTPYGVEKFSRPIYGPIGEDSYWGIFVGSMILFGFTFAATTVYAFMLSERKIWWLGAGYGIAFFILFGLFFRMQNWDIDTLSTEVAWFMSIGLFIGMSMTAERLDEE